VQRLGLNLRPPVAIKSNAEVGARLTDEKRTSVRRVQSSLVGVGDEAAGVSKAAGSVLRQRQVNESGGTC